MSIYENLIFGLRNEGILPNLTLHEKKYKLKIIDILKDFNLGLENRLKMNKFDSYLEVSNK